MSIPGLHTRTLRAGVTALLLGGAVAAPSVQASAQQVVALSDDFTQLSLEELLNIDVTSVSKRAEPLSQAAAAIYVLTGDEIQRSGVQSIAEALRLVPGLGVARTNANTYAISARGFQSGGDKMQVLLDGRSVYTPLTSSVFWDVLDTHLPDIDRIEVIRGPGATLWGANAVNGVINIITKPSSQTLGGSLTTGAGTEDRAHASLRSGTRLGDKGSIRFYAKAYDRDHARLASGTDARDGQSFQQGGVRTDVTVAENQTLSLSGDLYRSRVSGTGITRRQAIESDLGGGNLNGRWTLDLGKGDNLGIGLAFDQYRREVPETFSEQRDTYDLSVQHQMLLSEAQHSLIYGASYRRTQDETAGPPQAIIFDPANRTLETYGAFVQGQIHVADDLSWTLGTKVEHNDLTGYEIQPSTRVGWQVSTGWFAWGAVSRAVRTPNRLDHDIAIFCPPPVGFPGICAANTTLKIGNPGFDSEKLIAYEAGFRYTGSSQWSGDLSLFHNDYRDLRSTESMPPFFSFENQLEGSGTGFELATTWKPSQPYELRASCSYLHLDIRPKPGSTDTSTSATLEGSSPERQCRLRGSWWMSPQWALNGFLRYVGELDRVANPSATSGTVDIPAYTELNLRVSWRPVSQLELSLNGENLLDRQHSEYGSAASRSELQRAVRVDLAWQWQ